MDRTWIVDLSAERFWVEEAPLADVAPYLGGSGWGWRKVAENLPPRVDPYAPENVVALNPGLLVGTRTVGSPKLTAITKFPTVASPDGRHYIGSCTSGGRYFAPAMRQAGCDRLLIVGRAARPVVLAIRDGGVTIEDAGDLWGRGIDEVSRRLIAREGPEAGVLAIGTGGEKLVRNALAIIDRTNSLGRGGLGAVLGSKNVKAVVARGTGGLRAADPARYDAVSNELIARVTSWPRRAHWIKLGLAAGWDTFKHTQNPGMWPKDRWDELYGEAKRMESLRAVIACASCPLSCRLRWEIPGGEFDGETGLGSPYSKSATSGQLLGIEDDRKMIHLVTQANAFTGIDFYTTTRIIDFLTKMADDGRIAHEQDGVVLSRDYATIAKLFRMTADREGIGDVIADGWYRVQREFGLAPDEYWYAGVCKGVDFIYDARPSRFHPLMMTFLTRPRPHHGGSHTRTNSRNKTIEEFREQIEHWGLPTEVVDRIFTATPYAGRFNVGRYTSHMEDMMRVKNALGMCTIYTYQALVFGDDMARLYSAMTGDEIGPGELIARGERISNLAKLLNVREGFTRVEDRAPEVWFRPMHAPEGTIEMEDYFQTKVVTREDVDRMLDDYYDERGWTQEEGIPSPATLERFGLDELSGAEGSAPDGKTTTKPKTPRRTKR
ncbi:MAG: aldehyde ferredoxin oxidoreductase C-terminal domain-containing protein [Candidatus Bipolaricaulota bacterium]